MTGTMAKRKTRQVHPVIADLKRFRAKRDLSQRDFARSVGISVFTLRNWEQGRTHPDSATAAFIALYLASKK